MNEKGAISDAQGEALQAMKGRDLKLYAWVKHGHLSGPQGTIKPPATAVAPTKTRGYIDYGLSKCWNEPVSGAMRMARGLPCHSSYQVTVHG